MPNVKMSWKMSKHKFVKYFILLYILCSTINSTYGQCNDETQFTCSSGERQCIPINFAQDGDEDCSDGSDEYTDCEWSDWLPCNPCYNKTSRNLLKQGTFGRTCDEDVEIKDCEFDGLSNADEGCSFETVLHQVPRQQCAEVARKVSRQELAPYQPQSSYEAPAPPVEDLNGRPADCEWSDWLPCNPCYNKTSRKLLKQGTFSGKCDEDVEIKDCEFDGLSNTEEGCFYVKVNEIAYDQKCDTVYETVSKQVLNPYQTNSSYGEPEDLNDRRCPYGCDCAFRILPSQ